MEEARVKIQVEPRNETIDRLEEVGRTTVKVAASAVVATTLVGALSEPPNTDLITLPEPVPIIQLYQVEDDLVPDEDEETTDQESRLRRLLRMLKYLLIALALVGAIIFGALKGCAGVVGTTLLPHDDEQQEQSVHQGQTEDERGVASESAGI
jgi:hypothetical protein